MTAQHIALLVIDWAWLGEREEWFRARGRCYFCSYQLLFLNGIGGIAVYKAAVVVLRDEANFLTFRFGRYRHASFRCHGSHLGLCIGTQWKTRVSQLLLIQDMQDIGLIFAEVNPTAQSSLARNGMIIDTHVMARSHIVGIQCECSVEH